MKTQTQTNTSALRNETRPPAKRKAKAQTSGANGSTAGANSSSSPSYSDIAARAYAIWKEQGCPEGRENEHWQQAEEELTASTASAKG